MKAKYVDNKLALVSSTSNSQEESQGNVITTLKESLSSKGVTIGIRGLKSNGTKTYVSVYVKAHFN